jgi:hypothetical protein
MQYIMLSNIYIKCQSLNSAVTYKYNSLSPMVHHIQHGGKVTCRQQALKVLDSFLLRQIQPKLIQEMFMHVSMLDIRNIRIHHQRHQVDDQIRMLAEDCKCRIAKSIESLIVR